MSGATGETGAVDGVEPAASIHPPHVETYDVEAGINVDREGVSRSLDAWEVTGFGLYFSRPLTGHPTICWVQSWILPGLGIRVSDFRAHPGLVRSENHYVDVMATSVDGPVWRTVDHYLDILVRTGDGARVVDSDEFVAAVQAGLLGPADAERALESTYAAYAGIVGHGHDVDAWLRDLGIELTWAPPAEVG
ncbi:DUF402 domain-containing protein [Actinopolymorpha cephalotaxi]|uniref:DUF402 domain-containing protein n=1 Tax=Actinopolymorpha cephalotaxi TaxID=504797 RepID=A0ABX2S610_9ACTN|nr:DUF402 domain-containing protein [Actinopolymorpha cephalotaxi]NYH84478.1 hypothetical protein [Actinopolymorpha cephalotaxi]